MTLNKTDMKNIKILFSFIVLMFLGFATLNAQTTITGTVSDENQEALGGVNVVVQGTGQGTIPNNTGSY